MKILCVTNGLGSGGAERRMLSILKGLEETNKFSFEIISLNKIIHFKKEVDNLNAKLHIIERTPKKDPRVFLKVYKIAKTFQPDFIYTWGSMSTIYSIPSKILLRIPLYSNIINANAHLSFGTIFRYKLAFIFSYLIISNSKMGIFVYRAPKRKTICIPNGFDFDRLNLIEDINLVRKRYNISTRYVIGMVGGLEERKDYKTFIDISNCILSKRKDVTFISVGDGSYFNKIAESIPKDNREYVKLLGRIKNVESVINIMDIGILMSNPRFGEGISNVIMEYMAFSKPVIASAAGGNFEIVQDNITGYLIPNNDKNIAVEKIQYLLDNVLIRQKFGNQAKIFIEDNFRIDTMINLYIRLFINSSIC